MVGVDNIDQNLTGFMICLCFVLGVMLCQLVFYGDEIGYIIEGANFTGGISDALAYLWAFVGIFTAMMSISLPFASDPSIYATVLQIIILVPFWGCMIYILLPIISKIAELIIEGIDAIIPF